MTEKRLPLWLHKKIPNKSFFVEKVLSCHGVNTVCEAAKCPNRLECFSQKTATFLALGPFCTRACQFCSIPFSKSPSLPDPQEPLQIALSIKDLGLQHAVITMVTRDDLPDQGAQHIKKILQEISKQMPLTTKEVLLSDFSGQFFLLDTILEEKPEVVNHNIETTRALTPKIRSKALYERSLDLLRYVKQSKKAVFVKSGLMVGLGETIDEVKETLVDLYTAGCDIITIGQYLQSSPKNLPPKEFIPLSTFALLEEFGYSLGVKKIFSGPFVRSSYHAASIFSKN
ncbi:MAG: lipoyl synthase [Chlamydiota bacterium]